MRGRSLGAARKRVADPSFKEGDALQTTEGVLFGHRALR